MDFKEIKITDITPAKYNPRVISDDDYNKLSESITEFGFVDPIIINLKNNRIIGGHQRYNVLVEEYFGRDDDKLICIPLGDIGWVFPSDNLVIEDEAHEKALNVALNKISGQWDNEKLHNLLVDLEVDDFDLDLTGFKEYEIDKLKCDADVEFVIDDEELGNSDKSSDDESVEQNEFTGHWVTCPHCHGEFIPDDD